MREGVQLIFADADEVADARQIDIIEPLPTALKAVEVGRCCASDMKKPPGQGRLGVVRLLLSSGRRQWP